jgi:DNA-binding winged helix-turn-helix (wHTH) protein/predicted ATPase
MTVRFDRFRFDAANSRLEDVSGPIRLNRKAIEILRVLLERRGQLVLKDQLLDEVWPATHVADGVLKVRMTEIRRALGDSAAKPRFIETVHGRGYRFIADVATMVAEAWPPAGSPPARPAMRLVGRGPEIELLEGCLARALGAERQVVFVSGEAGIGKTALVEHFVGTAAERAPLAVVGGQCLEQSGAAEAYMPVLEAVGRMVRGSPPARALLQRSAPTWLAQLPWLVDAEDQNPLDTQPVGASGRMLREMGEFLEALAAEVPLILVLEDLHWSDPSTVDLVSLLAARRDRARLLLLATYRSGELIRTRHPLRAALPRLMARRDTEKITLDHLGVDAVAEYLEQRFSGSSFEPALAGLVHERTGGNPLFMVALVDHLLAREAIVTRDGHWKAAEGLLAELAGVPEELRLLIEQQLAHLGAPDRELLEAASLVGIAFSASVAAAGADGDTTAAERRCERLALTGSLIHHAGIAECPDGSVAGRYAFRHGLYREALAASMSPRRRTEAHLRIGRVIEGAYGERAADLAAELAVHFEAGGHLVRAAHYRRLAAETDMHRYAFAEAEIHLEKGIELLGRLPASPERDREELLLQGKLGSVRIATHGHAAPEVERAYLRALELSGTPQEAAAFPILWGLWNFYYARPELARALEFAERNRVLAEATGDRVMRLEAHHALWATRFFRGEFAAALSHLDAGEPLYDRGNARRYALLYGHDPKVSALSFRSAILWSVGRVDSALELSHQAIELAHALGDPMSLGLAMTFAGFLRLFRREPQACRAHAEALIAFAAEKGMPAWVAYGRCLRGWALTEEGSRANGIAESEEADALALANGANASRSYFRAALGIAKARAGRLAEARRLIEQSKVLVASSDLRFFEPEIHRLDAELVLTEAGGSRRASAAPRQRAEALLRSAIECASRQGARTYELRATTSLARLCGRGTKGATVRARLSELAASFTEGDDTADLKDARRLLAH